MLLRMKAIFDCLWFGLVPSCVYEEEPHYGEGLHNYLKHMRINASVAIHWVTFTETPEMVELAKRKTVYVRY